MPTINRKCNFCGKEYYVCRTCERQNSWKNICCSRQCYRKLLAQNTSISLVPQKMNLEVKNMNIRAGLINGKTITISGYDLELGKFDCLDGATRSFEDFAYFIIPSEEFQSIGKKLNDKIETPVVTKKKIVADKQETAEK